jgi:hypothetical protein
MDSTLRQYRPDLPKSHFENHAYWLGLRSERNRFAPENRSVRNSRVIQIIERIPLRVSVLDVRLIARQEFPLLLHIAEGRRRQRP